MLIMSPIYQKPLKLPFIILHFHLQISLQQNQFHFINHHNDTSLFIYQINLNQYH